MPTLASNSGTQAPAASTADSEHGPLFAGSLALHSNPGRKMGQAATASSGPKEFHFSDEETRLREAKGSCG